MDQPAAATSGSDTALRPVFISYATGNRSRALDICEDIERRGVRCWISCRDVAPGENYQEAIVRALRGARAVVLAFSDAANTSDEIKKELSLASRYHIPVMALRIEDVEPCDAFAYELSTRQWVDAFDGWEDAIDALVGQVGDIASAPASVAPATPARRRMSRSNRRKMLIAASLVVLLLAIGGAWWFLRPVTTPDHSMMVRLAGFNRLSDDLPSTMPDAMRDEITAAFANDGTVGVSTATSAPPGTAPAYALSGTVRHDGDKIRVIATLSNERSGTSLWSESLVYDQSQASAVPRKVAVAAGNMVRCGLFGASTYRKALPDRVMADYLQYCRFSGQIEFQPTRALDFAHKIVAAAPDFSWGWSANSNAAMLANSGWPTGQEGADLRAAGLAAADKALQLDPDNSEALGNKSQLIDPASLAEREQLLKRALAARPQSCGCEHFMYANLLLEVGRISDASEQFRRANELNPLDVILQWGLADALLATGKAAEAKPHLDSVVAISSDPDMPKSVAIGEALLTGDLQGALNALRVPPSYLPADQKDAFVAGFQALRSNNPAARAEAIRLLSSARFGANGYLASNLLAALGANREALKTVSDEALARTWAARSWLFYPDMRPALSDPAFPAIAKRLGLINYWKATHSKPDVCSGKSAPPFCRMI